MSTTYVPVIGTMALLPNFLQNTQKVNNTPVPMVGRTVIPPPPLPQTLIGTAAVTSYST